MQPNKRQKPMQEAGLYDSVNLSSVQDRDLEDMQKKLKALFNKTHDGNADYETGRERLTIAVGAATAYAAICTEQRERAVLRAHKKHFKKT